MSIKKKILLAFLIVAFSIGLLGAGTFYHDMQSAETIARHEATNIARLLMAALQHELHETGSTLGAPATQRSFQGYVDQYKKFQRRDMVVIDRELRIIADTITEEVGKIFHEDPGGEVRQTLHDGQTRFFVEQNATYPQGIKQMVFPFDDDGGRIGAIVMEYTLLYDEIIAGVKAEAKKFLLYFALALVFAVLIGSTLASNIELSLGKLKQAALDIAADRLHTRVETGGPSELALLAKSFNLMAENLEKSKEKLRSSNQRLEAESASLRQSEESLRKSEERFRVLFESANVGIMQVSGEGRIAALNNAFASLHGYTVDEMLHMDLTDLITAESTRLLPERVQRMMDGEKLFFEVEHYCKDGRTIPLEVSASMVTIGGEKYLLAFHRDITQRLQAEKEQKELWERLQQSQKMESIGTLSGGIAHDFNNILASMSGYSQLALMRPTGSSVWRDDIQQVLKACERAADLVCQILTFSRKQPQEKMPIKVSALVKEALKLLRASIPSTIDIRHEIKTNGYIVAAPTQIHQVIINLCTNASHAMLDHGGTLTLFLEEIDLEKTIIDSDTELPAGRYVSLQVSDTGCGMTPEVKAKIFEPYFTTREVGKGTGLGLAVVYGIVKSHQGMISVESELGRGTTFTVLFPAVSSVVVQEVAATTVIPVAKANVLIMVVDDEIGIQEFISESLELAGYGAKSFGDGLEAWHAFSSTPGDWDLIITDKTMPRMTGLQLAAKVAEVRPEIPVILCSGHHTPDAGGDTTPGIYACLHKPIRIDNLLALVAEAIDKTKKPGALTGAEA